MRHDVERQLHDSERLFVSLADQFSQAYTQIARLAELGQLGSSEETLGQILTIAQAANRLADGYATGMRQGRKAAELLIEPVAVQSILHDAERALRPFADEHNVQLELAQIPRLELVLCDREVMQMALICLGQVIVAAESEQEKPQPVRLDAYRTKHGIVAGLYSETAVLNKMALRRAKKLFGRTRQPLSLLASGAASGVFVADKLLAAMQAELHVAHHNHLTGLATTLPRCNQMQLV